MLQVFTKDLSRIKLENNNPDINIEKVNEHINLCDSKYMTVDITELNIMDACMVSATCSTEHYLKHPEGKINWIVNSPVVKEYTDSMNLGNSHYFVKH